MQEQERVGRAGVDQRQAGDHPAQQQRVAEQQAAVAEAVEQWLGQGLGEHGRERQGNHRHPRLCRWITQRNLQQQGREEGQGAAAQAREEIAEDAGGEGAGAEQRRGEQRLLNLYRVQPVGGQAGHAAEQQQHHPPQGALAQRAHALPSTR
ncbi:hypothetical protein D9M71_211010 [compost metagenome]